MPAALTYKEPSKRTKYIAIALLQAIGSLFGMPGEAEIRRDLVVPFQMVNGRVYHSNFEIPFRNATVRTRGSVGLDGTLALIAEMPIPEKLLGSGRLSAA